MAYGAICLLLGFHSAKTRLTPEIRPLRMYVSPLLHNTVLCLFLFPPFAIIQEFLAEYAVRISSSIVPTIVLVWMPQATNNKAAV